MNTIPAKTIISKRSDPSWFGMDYNMNLYRGCNHGCIYCDSRSDCYRITDFDTVRVKENAINILEDELHRRIRTGVIGTGSMSDPYNPFEKTCQLTRKALELIRTYHFGVGIATKSNLIERDIDLLSEIKEHSPVICKITITASDDCISSKIEPKVCPSSLRFEAIRKLSAAGVFAGILMMPLLPGITDTPDNVLEIIHKAHHNGARFIYPLFGLSLRAGQREYFYQKLDEYFPEQRLKASYIRQYGSLYECHSPREHELSHIFTEECRKIGLLYQMEDIIKAYKSNYLYQQLSLF